MFTATKFHVISDCCKKLALDFNVRMRSTDIDLSVKRNSKNLILINLNTCNFGIDSVSLQNY